MAAAAGINMVDYVEQQYNKALELSQEDRDEALRMREMYTGFGKSQWSTTAKSKLQERGNITPQINLSKGKIKRLAGSIVKNYFNVSFVPVSSTETELTRTLNDLFLSDSNTYDYSKSYMGCVIDALIHQGIEQMVTTTRYDPLGSIKFERIMPGHVIIDPSWKSDDTWDITEVFKLAYLTPPEIVAKYGFKNPNIQSEIDTILKDGIIYDDDTENESTAHSTLQARYGQKYRIIERHYLESTAEVIKFAKVDGQDIDIPNGEQEQEEFFSLLEAGGIVPEVISRRVERRTYKVQSSCRELSPFKLLEDAESDIQIGRLPFFPLSSDRYGGTNSGVMALLEDVQKLLNGREASIDDVIATSATGAYLFDPILTGNNDVLTQRAIEDMHKPDAVIKTAPGMLASGRQMIMPIARQQFPGELYQEVQRMAGYFDALSGQTATLDGMQESSQDTGVLFARRALQSEIALTALTKCLESHQKDKFEAWMLYAKVLYSGAYREIGVEEANPIALNEREYGETGEVIAVHNDLSELPRHKVIITPSKDGLTVREVDRARSIELLQYIQSPIKRVLLEQQALETLDNSIKDKTQLREYNDLELAVAVATMENNLASMQAATAQARLQVEQMDMQNEQMAQQMQAPAEGEVPVEGEAPVEEAPVEEAPTEEAPVEATVEEAPIEPEAPVEEAPMDEAVGEEPLIQ